MSEGMIIRRGGGGGGLSPNAAVLTVTAPIGSTITITKGGTSKTQDASKGHPSADDASVAKWYFSISTANFGTWTVTATLGSETATGTIVIDAADEYDLILSYHVPSGYQEVEYLESDSAQYIDTGIIANGHQTIECKWNNISARDGYCRIYGGQRNNSYDQKRTLTFRTSTNNISVGYNNSDIDYNGISINTLHTSISDKNITTIDNTVVAQHTYADFTASVKIYLFAFNSSGSVDVRGKKRIYYFKIVDNNVKVMELYPCYRKSDSVAGMWDRVSETFYTNAGSGTFAVGGDVN